MVNGKLYALGCKSVTQAAFIDCGFLLVAGDLNIEHVGISMDYLLFYISSITHRFESNFLDAAITSDLYENLTIDPESGYNKAHCPNHERRP
jgi:hypothetical protein